MKGDEEPRRRGESRQTKETFKDNWKKFAEEEAK